MRLPRALSCSSMNLSTLDDLASQLRGHRIAVLTGAGISTESGIPDYRGPETRRRARQPIHFQEFVASLRRGARYWARSMVGWPLLARRGPTPGTSRWRRSSAPAS